ncbi:MAG: sulfate ABC transporter permease subunit CysW [Deltaproteobacteria bacterium]|nr:sulfate ABC transporter permease subunit CysW [Deltaproteobacteria bacterium]
MPTPEPKLLRWTLIGLALLGLAALVVLPLLLVLIEAFSEGWPAWREAVTDEETLSAIRLSLAVAAVAVPLNTVAGLAAAWALARFRFRGRGLLLTLLDLPLSISPVVSGLLFVLLFGAQGWLGPWLQERDIQVLFAFPGLVLATTFVTLPLVARELLPLLEALGPEEEIAAITLGASPWQLLWQVVLPRLRWGLVYGVILCTARALGEFGAVSVVSGHIRGETCTLPLHIEVLHSEYHFQAAFAAASLLSLVGLLGLLARRVVGARIGKAH